MCVLQVIYLYRAGLVKKGAIDKVSHTREFEYLILFIWLIQSHSQRGSPSANLGDKDPNG